MINIFRFSIFNTEKNYLQKPHTKKRALFFCIVLLMPVSTTFAKFSKKLAGIKESVQTQRECTVQKQIDSALSDRLEDQQDSELLDENKHSILVSIPTYNEKGNIRPLYESLKALPVQVDILFIDDNSPDGSGEEINNLCDEDCSVYAIHRTGKLGLGSAHMRGLNFARTNGYSHVITMDADFLHDPKYIPEMVEKSKDADIVIGSRYVDGGAYDAVKGSRKYLTYFWRWCIKSCLGLNYDATGSYRMYNVKILDPEILKKVKAKGFDFNLETLYRLKKAGATVAEIPIQAHARLYGETKLTARDQKAVWGNFCSLCWDKFRNK